ncbi:PucR family transcriptional regulator, partial [Enterococcus faecium]
TTYFITSQKLPQKDGQTLELYFIREEEQLTSFEMNQAVEVVQMALNLWGKNYDEGSEYALVQAIINDESDKMYQLAKKLMIDISSVETMWLLP